MTGTSTAGVLVTTVAELPTHVGRRLGPTGWQRMEQSRVDAFAGATGDNNPIHVDPARAAQTPFGGTIAHGYLSLSLLAPMAQHLIQVTDAATAVNYGLDKVRFPAPVPVGSELRGRAEIIEVAEIEGGVQAKATFALEIKRAAKPGLVAECLFRYYI